MVLLICLPNIYDLDRVMLDVQNETHVKFLSRAVKHRCNMCDKEEFLMGHTTVNSGKISHIQFITAVSFEFLPKP